MTREEAIKTIMSAAVWTDDEREALGVLIPELKESDDERIRKYLIEELKAAKSVGELKFVIPQPTREDCIDYLEKQKEIPMPNSTELIDMWYKEKAMLEEKDFRDDAWRFAQNAFMDGFVRGTCVKSEKQKDASKAIEAVDRIDKYIDEHLANAHDMKDSNPDKKYYRGWDDALGKMSGILQDVYSNEKQKESLSDFINDFPYSDEERAEIHRKAITQLPVQGKGVYKICPRCKERMIMDDSKVYTSMPPQYGYKCPKCGELEFDTVIYDSPVDEEQKPILEVFGFKVGDAVRLKDGDGRKHIIKSFEEVEGIHGPNFYHVEFEDNSARDGIYPGEEYPNGYYTQMEKFEEEQKPVEKQDYSGLTDLERAIHRGFLATGIENVPVTIIKETAQECLAQMKPADIDEYEIIKKHITEDSLSSEVNKRLTECGWYVTDEKPTEWSEEDKRKLNRIYEILGYAADDKGFLTSKRIIGDKEAIELQDFLKSFRPTWKPSEEQMSMLLAVINEPNNAGSESCHLALTSLYNHLKKLM